MSSYTEATQQRALATAVEGIQAGGVIRKMDGFQHYDVIEGKQRRCITAGSVRWLVQRGKVPRNTER